MQSIIENHLNSDFATPALERRRLREIAACLAAIPFKPASGLGNPYVQSFLSPIARRWRKLPDHCAESRLFQVAQGVTLLAQCSWQPEHREKPTLLALHGLEGSTDSPYMIVLAEKALRAGFNVVRLNLRGCGDTDLLSSTLYHAGLSWDIFKILDELIGKDRLGQIYLAGFSLGGNIVLKLAGELGDAFPVELSGVIAVSPPIDMASCISALETRSNFYYHMRFLCAIKKHLRRRARLFPHRYDESWLRRVRTVRQFDCAFTAPEAGYRDVEEFYQRISSLPLLAQIAVPTLVIHAQDDPIIPFDSFQRSEIRDNPRIILLSPECGGHVGFISARCRRNDYFWAESKAIEFIRLLSRSRISFSASLRRFEDYELA